MARAEPLNRILMTADAVGGVWTYAEELCRQLDRRGIEVTLAVMGPQPSADQRARIALLKRVTLHASPFKLEWMSDPWDDVTAAGEWLLGLESRVVPDIVHLNGYCHGACGWHAPALVVGHSCVLSWWKSVYGEPAPPAWDRYARGVRDGVQHAAAVAAPSSNMLAWLEELYGPLPRSRVIANGRSRVEGAPPKEPLVLTAGRLWDEAKNVAAVCHVAASIAWPVAVAGAAGENPADQPFPGMFDRVRYLGRLPEADLRLWMARASIYALPARYEPFGLSVLEAALAGCALVLGDIPTLREVWGDAAIYVPPEDHEALRRALDLLVKDEQRRNTMAAAAVARAATLTPQRMADEYCGLYEELIRERRPLLSLSAV